MPVVRIQSALLARLSHSQSDIPPHSTENIILHFLLFWVSLGQFFSRKPAGTVACQAFHQVQVVTLDVPPWRGPGHEPPPAEARDAPRIVPGFGCSSGLHRRLLFLPVGKRKRHVHTNKDKLTETDTHVHTYMLGIIQRDLHTPTRFFILSISITSLTLPTDLSVCSLSLWACYSRLQTLPVSCSLYFFLLALLSYHWLSSLSKGHQWFCCL